MHFSRIVSIFIAFFTFGLVAFAIPVPEVEARSDASVMSVFTSLQTSTTPILSKITAAGNNQAAMEPFLNELISSLQTAQNSLALSELKLSKRQSVDAIANVVAGVTTDIAIALEPLTAATIVIVPEVSILLAEVDEILNSVIVDADILVVGLSVAVSGLLVGVSGILKGLGFTLFLITLAL